MTIETSAPDLREIRAAIIARLDELRPLVEEAERLERAEAALEKTLARLASEGNGGSEAPYGYKADGTPRKRRPPSDPDYARRGWETRRNAPETA